MKKSTEIKLKKLIERIIREESSTKIDNDIIPELTNRLIQFFRSGSQAKLPYLLKDLEIDSNYNVISGDLTKLSRELNSSSDEGLKNILRISIKQLNK